MRPPEYVVHLQGEHGAILSNTAALIRTLYYYFPAIRMDRKLIPVDRKLHIIKGTYSNTACSMARPRRSYDPYGSQGGHTDRKEKVTNTSST